MKQISKELVCCKTGGPGSALPSQEVEEGRLPGGGDHGRNLKRQVEVHQARKLRERVEKELGLAARLGRR